MREKLLDRLISRTWTINGEEANLRFAPEERLLDVVRNHLALTGSKPGCEEGECGTCSILIDGDLKLACLTLAAALPPGTEVTTVEGLAGDAAAERLKKAFVAKGAVQCGYCTPGMLVAGYWLLKNPEIEAREGLAGNLCRCTGYQMIVDAVESCRPRKAVKKTGKKK